MWLTILLVQFFVDGFCLHSRQATPTSSILVTVGCTVLLSWIVVSMIRNAECARHDVRILIAGAVTVLFAVARICVII